MVHQRRLECARIGREEVLRALAEEAESVVVEPAPAPAPPACPVPVAAPDVASEPVGAAVSSSASREGYDPRPPAWQPGLDAEILAGACRQVFEAVAGAGAPVAVRVLALALGRDATRLNETEKVRHRAYALQGPGWLARVPGGLFTMAPGPVRAAGAGGTRASADGRGPSSGQG